MSDELDRAVDLLGPLEGRIMRIVWTERVTVPFKVRDVHELLPELAYTTVMSTMRRLAEKGLLTARMVAGPKGFEYAPAGAPADFLAAGSVRAAAEVIAQYGDTAFAAFAAHLDELSPEQRAALDRLRRP